jgi:hypothetical protein
MFLHLLPKDKELFCVVFTDHAKRHFLKKFQKDYKGKVWLLTEESIFQDLSRLRMPDNTTQQTQQIDEIWHKDNRWIFKYDFAVAGKKESPKKSGNRVVGFLDTESGVIEILLIFNHKDLPKNTNETQYIKSTLEAQFPDHLAKCR